MFSLENKHLGEDVYVVGAGKSVDFYPNSFFEGKTIIGVNQVGKKVPCDYTVRKEGAESYGSTLVRSQYRYGSHGAGENTGLVFSQNDNLCTKINSEGLHPLGEKLVVSFSTITSAIHLAAFMGAQNIYIVGHDCKAIDGEVVFSGYYDDAQMVQDGEKDYADWLKGLPAQTEWIKDYCESMCGCSVVFVHPRIEV